jgi:DNA repair protein RecO (recombination protein O)
VLRTVEFSESSCVLTLFTEDFGKIGALAKGAKRPKGPFEGALDLLALIRIVFLHKSSEALDLLTEAKLERRFRAGQRDLARLYAGYYVAELLAELTETGDEHRLLFQVADATLAALDGDAPVAETILKFELAALREAGHLPSLDVCVACGQPVESEKRVAFGMTAGGVLCEACRPGRRGVVSVSEAVIAALRNASANELGDANETSDVANNSVSLDPKLQGELRAVMSNYFAHLIGRRLRLSEYLGSAAKT